MSAHTPGPWHVEHGTPSGRRLVADLVEGDLRLTHFRIVHDGESEGGGEADALLIAAAPDLLAAALLIQKALKNAALYASRSQVEALFAAITKATGQ